VDLFAELVALIRAFDAAECDYAVCGALALAIHGVPRATRDIDVLVESAHLGRLRTAARTCGFTIEALPMTFSSSGITVHRFTKLGGPHPIMLDALVADGPLASVWADRRRLPFSEGVVSVVGRAGLITLKLAAGRPQDLVDVQRLQEIDDGDTDV
jgi:hypothetical protein